MSFGKSIASRVGKHRVAIMATVTCTQLFCGTAVRANHSDPSSVYTSCYPASTGGSTFYPYFYAQWGASPYSGTDKMYFYLGVGVTAVSSGAYAVRFFGGPNSGAPRWAYATTNSDSFFASPDGFNAGPTYSADGDYEVGLQADDGTLSNITWVGAVKNT